MKIKKESERQQGKYKEKSIQKNMAAYKENDCE